MIKPTILFSKCFFEPVRYNGERIVDDFVEKLKKFVNCVYLCPEVEISLGVPRKHLIIIKNNGEKKLIQPETDMDLTDRMLNYIKSILINLKEIDGAVLKAKSPSCGVGSAKLYKKGVIIGRTDGFFAEYLKKEFPFLPLEDEGRLKNKEIRNHFLIRIFAYSEIKEIIKNPTHKKLIDFHTKYKYLLMTYSQKHLKQLGNIVADGKISLKEKISKYKEIFYNTFKQKPTRSKHINTLMHIFGHISEHLNNREKKHFLNLLEKYRNGKVELRVLIELTKNFAYRFEKEYLLMQKYLEPFPEELID
ncbi:MAG: DUF523 and DUF1722 domain-containing protein [candidate division WOR-3 bacterium]